MDWTPQQEQAITARAPRICVDAGAGSGKTRILVERIAGILRNHEATLNEIVAITFMEKAAAEMKDRLRLTFRAHAARPGIHRDEMTYWRDLERRVEMARLCTIHSFCTTLLRENALRLGLDPDFAVLAEAETALLLEEVVTGALHRLFADEDESAVRLATEMGLGDLKKLMQKAIQRRPLLQRIAQHTPLGDARVLLEHWRGILEQERERRLLALKHSRKIRRFIKELHRFDGKCTNPADVREVKRGVMLDTLQLILSSENAETVEKALERMVEKPKERGSRKNWNPESAFKGLTDVQDDVYDFANKYLKNELNPDLELRAARQAVDFYRTFQAVLTAFTEAKERVNAFDFDDLIQRTLQMLHENEELCAAIAQDIKFLLIDEFQDTDGLQLEIARLLCDREKGPALFIVGDAKQSIYYFRGAEVEVFQTERRRAQPILPLDCNFRSLPDVLEFINYFFTQSGMLDAVEPYPPMAAFREALNEPRVEFLLTSPPEGEKWNAEETRRAEAEGIAARITELCGGSSPLSVYDKEDKVWRPCAFGDITLLFRAMTNVYMYAEALRKAGIPHVVVSGTGFFKRQEVIDVLNVLKVIIEPWDGAAVLGYLRGPIGGLSDESVLRLTQAGRLARVFDSEQVPEGFVQTPELQRARGIIAQLRSMVDLPLPDFFRRVLEHTGYEAVALTQFPPVQRASNVRKLIDLAQNFAHQRPPSLRGFVRYIEELGSQNIREGEAVMQPEGAGAVTLMSIHKSKGLEFPVVFLPDLTPEKRGGRNSEALFLHRQLGMALKVTDPEGKPAFPALGGAIKERIEEEEDAESARTLYVAMTRARDYLVLCGNNDPGTGGWFDELDSVFNVLEQHDGAVLRGEHWQAVVRNSMRASVTARPLPRSLETCTKEYVRRHLAKVVPVARNQNTFSISSILDAMAEGFDKEEEGDAEARVERRGAVFAMRRGSLFHRMLELWDFTPGRPPDFQVLLAESGLGRTEQERLLTDMRATAERFRKNTLYGRLAADSGLRRELPFLLNVGDALVNGTLDALLSDGTIIDYKTGPVRDDRHDRYEWQLLLYAAAVRMLTGHAPARGLLYYLDEDTVKEVPLPGDQIESALRHAREMIARMRAKGKEEA